MYRAPITRRLVTCLMTLVLLTATQWPAPAAAAMDHPGAVYTLTNQVSGNAVAIFTRAADGRLAPTGAIATGGTGTGAGLGSQGALTLSTNQRWLFAINAGSNDISVFAVSPTGGLTLTDRVAAGGTRPTSVTQFGHLVYVLNAGGAGNIAGFTLSPHGELAPLAGSSRPLSSTTANPAQVQFSPDGQMLVVTERATNRLSAYAVGPDGLATGPDVYPSSGAVPFGFAFARPNLLVVSEAGRRAVSSYAVSPAGVVSVVSGSVDTDQNAACWIAVTQNGRFAYTTNAGSASITGYRIEGDGSLARLDPAGPTATTGMTPLDMAIPRSSRYLYVLEAGSRTVGAFAIQPDGSLAPLGSTGMLPAGSVGLAAV